MNRTTEPPRLALIAAAQHALGIDALVAHAMHQPIAEPVPADDAFFIASKGSWRVALRSLKRSAELTISGQRSRLRQHIEPNWTRVLWIHAEAPQIGDALMDLAPRSLLIEHGLVLDLLAAPAVADLFRGDRAFGRVFSKASAVQESHYDLVIVDSHSRKAVAAKRESAPGLPWVSIREAYLGYDFQRGLLATRRLARLLGVSLDAEAECRHARQKLLLADETGAAMAHKAGGIPISRSAADRDAGATSEPCGGDALERNSSLMSNACRIGVAVGGVRAERTYALWPEVLAALAKHGVRAFTMLGTVNGRDAANRVIEEIGSGADVVIEDLVGRTTLHEARNALAACRAVVCADGGLMHLALTTSVPVIALFDSSVDPAWRLPLEAQAVALRASERDVSLIRPEEVAHRVLKVLGEAPPISACAT